MHKYLLITKSLPNIILLFVVVFFFSSCNTNKLVGESVHEQTVREIIGESQNHEIIYGVDTGLTQQQYDKFREDYRKAVNKYSFATKYHFEDTAFKLFLGARINLNKLDKLIELGWKPGTVDNGYTDEILTRGRIILMGSTTDSMKYTYKNGYKYGKIWQFKIDKILNGSEIMNEGDQEGSIIYVIDFSYQNGSFELGYLPNTQYILFINQYESYPKTDPPRTYYTGFKGKYVIDGDFVYDVNWYKVTETHLDFREKNKISLESYLKLIKDVLEVNDSKNFFNRTYH